MNAYALGIAVSCNKKSVFTFYSVLSGTAMMYQILIRRECLEVLRGKKETEKVLDRGSRSENITCFEIFYWLESRRIIQE